jgi:large subunit ribosomal protein L21
VSLLQVLLADSRKATLLGHPEIAGASVRGQVEEKSNDKKVIIFKMRRRKNAKRLRGFRRQVTMCHNTDIIIYYENTILAAQYLYLSL